MDDQQFYSAEGISEQKPKHNFIVPIIVLTLIIILGGVGLLFLTGKFSRPEKKSEEITSQSLPSSTTKAPSSQKTLEKKLSNTVKNLASSTASKPGSSAKPVSNYPDIQKYVDAAEKDTTLAGSYDFYVKAYAAMLIAYKQTKDPKYTGVMSDLKKLVVGYPQYKIGDFPAQWESY